MNVPIGVAIVGAGYWGRNLIRNFLESDQFDVKWVVDFDEGAARQVLGSAYPRTRITADVVSALDDPLVEAIVVATPAVTHAELGRRALAAGKHLLVEKPLAHTAEAGRELVDLAAREGLTLMVDHTYCYAGPVQLLADLVHDESLGEPLVVHSTRINKGLVRLDVDVIWDLAAHDLSILAALLPPGIHVESVQAQGADPFADGHLKEAVLAVHLSNGGLAHITVSWLSPVKQRTMSIVGTKASVHWDDLDESHRIMMHGFTGTPDLGPASSREASTRVIRPLEFTDMTEVPYDTTEALRLMVAEFARAIKTSTSPRTDGAAGMVVLRMLEAASESVRHHGAPVKLA
ncbi:Gfo/Idh/MocA family protein [Protaetiibacter intestinalis]|uniref:Gfo/Idh/MocA family protein n=1 Tax=Protaetiibacter intestinalis TaxID=2419774 RepID=UPI0013002479|nr:Gfo/Idh/MocA family oxidoreductase [Protaetiibacter intestinalis]